MAGDWIKMRGNLWDDPRVSRICDLCNTTEGPVIGALYWLWATADQHTETGLLPGQSLRQIDRKTGVQGFGQALCDIGWIEEAEGGIRILRFDEHNGTSAKRRCMEAQRKANDRKLSASDADTTRTDAGQGAPETGQHAELEKEKEKRKRNTPQPPKGEGRFAEFWDSWPNTERKQDRKKCLDKWRRNEWDGAADAIVAHVTTMKATRKWLDGFEPAPLTYLNGERWRDGVTVDSANDPNEDLYRRGRA